MATGNLQYPLTPNQINELKHAQAKLEQCMGLAAKARKCGMDCRGEEAAIQALRNRIAWMLAQFDRVNAQRARGG